MVEVRLQKRELQKSDLQKSDCSSLICRGLDAKNAPRADNHPVTPPW
jgi:hypothetical protein